MRSVAVLVVCLIAVGCTPNSATEADPSVAGQPSARASANTDLASRAAHTMTPLSAGAFLVAGGCVVDGCGAATATAFVISGEYETQTQSMTEPRDAHSATRLNDGRILVAGGFAAEGTAPLDTAEIYDPAEERWLTVGRMRTGRGGHAAALFGDGTVLVAGGWGDDGRFTASTEIFDPGSGTFSAGPELPKPVLGPEATSLADGSVLVTGGQLPSRAASNLALRIYPDGVIRAVGPLLTGRFKHAVVTLPSGEALVIGGTTDDMNLLADTEFFDPTSEEFSGGPRLLEGRYKMSSAAAVLADGRVVVAGGGIGVEVLDVDSGRSDRVPEAGRSLASFSSVGVSKGVLRVIGGYDEEINLTGTDFSLPVDQL